MKKQEKQLSNYCRWNQHLNVDKLFKTHSDLDLTIEEGICFIFAIKYQNAHMLKSLLSYYENTKLQGYQDSMKYKTAKYILRQILEEATEQYSVTNEMQEIMAPYVSTADDSTENSDSEPEDIACDRSWLDSLDNHDIGKDDSINLASLTASNLSSLGNKTCIFDGNLKLSGDNDDSDS